MRLAVGGGEKGGRPGRARERVRHLAQGERRRGRRRQEEAAAIHACPTAAVPVDRSETLP